MKRAVTADFSVVDPYRMMRIDRGFAKSYSPDCACMAHAGQYQRNPLSATGFDGRAGFGASIGWIIGGCLVTVVVLMMMFAGCAALIAGSQ